MRKLLLVLAAVAAAAAPAVVLAPSADAATPARVVRWIDGDTVVTSRGTIRLIGVDTPERGRCAYTTATRYSARLAPAGSIVQLGNPTSVRDRDRYGRLLRYVDRGPRDISAAQIGHGARARYDSRDGYQRHPRQARYRWLDAHHRNYRCARQTSSPATGPVRPNGWNCPSYAPIKGNRSSMIYHRPGQAYYAATNPEQCFRTAASAEAAGYRAAKI